MPSFKHVFLALVCLASQHAGMATASPTKLRLRSDTAYPTAVFTGAPTGVPAAFTAAPSGSGAPGPDHKHGGPGDFGPGATNHTRHTEHHDHHHHHNQTGGPDLDLHHNRTDLLLPSGTPTGSFISLITPPPDAAAVTVAGGAKFVQTTYYSCVTIGPDSHCGWHEPILDAGTSNSAGHSIAAKTWLSAVVVVAVVVWM